MKIKILDRSTLGSDLPIDLLHKFGTIEAFENTCPEELADRISDAEVVIINKIKITDEILSAAQKLRLICVFATGYDNVDIVAAKAHGVAVCNVPAYSTESVTLFTVSTVLSLFTHLNEYRSFVSSGKYTESGKANCVTPVYHEIKGKTWGIIGFGNIGKRVGEVAKALGARVIVNKVTPIDEYECVDIRTLCRESDIITIHCPLNEKTRGLISAELISMMKPSVLLVNEARGAVTDENAVAEAILNKKIAAFGTDVYSVEPFSREHPFNQIAGLPNVCLTPHSAWAAYEARERAMQIVCKNIELFLREKTLNRVDK